MKTKKIKNIESTVNPFNPVTQKSDYDAYNDYCEFIDAQSVGYGDTWDDDIAAAWLDAAYDENRQYETARLESVINQRVSAVRDELSPLYEIVDWDIIGKGKRPSKKAIESARRKIALIKRDNVIATRNDIESIGNIAVSACLKALTRKSADGYVLDVISGKRPIDIMDMRSVARESLYQSLAVYHSAPPTGKYIDLNDVQKRRVLRRNVTAFNHVPTDSDYTVKEKTVYDWMTSAVYAYIQSMRGQRVKNPTRVKDAVAWVPVKGKRGKVIAWKEFEIAHVVNNSVYFQHFSTDELAPEELFRMKATSINCDVHGNGINQGIIELARRMESEKVLTNKQKTVLSAVGFKLNGVKVDGDSFRTAAGALGIDESTVREHFKSAVKNTIKWLEKNGYAVTVTKSDDGKSTNYTVTKIG